MNSYRELKAGRYLVNSRIRDEIDAGSCFSINSHILCRFRLRLPRSANQQAHRRHPTPPPRRGEYAAVKPAHKPAGQMRQKLWQQFGHHAPNGILGRFLSRRFAPAASTSDKHESGDAAHKHHHGGSIPSAINQAGQTIPRHEHAADGYLGPARRKNDQQQAWRESHAQHRNCPPTKCQRKGGAGSRGASISGTVRLG